MVTTGPNIHQQRSVRAAIYRLVDGSGILFGLHFSSLFGVTLGDHATLGMGLAAVVAFQLAAEFTYAYRSWRSNRADQEIACALVTWMWTAMILVVVGFATHSSDQISRSLVLLWFLITPVLLIAARLVLRRCQQWLLKHGWNTRRFAIVGVNDLSLQLAENIESSAELGLKLVGFFDDRSSTRTPDLPDNVGRRIGDLDQLIAQTRQAQVDIIYITFPMRAEGRIRHVLKRLSDTPASVYIVPDFFVFELLHSRWTNIGGLPAVSIFENPLYGVDGIVKRLADVCLASVLLAILGIPMAIIAGMIKLTSPGPVFFRQKRYGLDGQEILVWKFRSMTVCENGERIVQAKANDYRVTKLGAILRKTSLDELPQLFNVLAGSMSLVGPRPHANAHNEQFRQMIQGYMLRYKVKPGITGLAQVNGWRGETDTLEKMERRIECDHRYIREWSLWLDIKILFRTIFVVLSRQNAY